MRSTEGEGTGEGQRPEWRESGYYAPPIKCKAGGVAVNRKRANYNKRMKRTLPACLSIFLDRIGVLCRRQVNPASTCTEQDLSYRVSG